MTEKRVAVIKFEIVYDNFESISTELLHYPFKTQWFLYVPPVLIISYICILLTECIYGCSTVLRGNSDHFVPGLCNEEVLFSLRYGLEF
jgi:hypothetical protein